VRAPQASVAGTLVRKTAVQLVADEVRSRILAGTLQPGSVLRQEALADELGVSRIPLREAIRLLSSEGLVHLVPHKGAYVAALSSDEALEFFQLRLKLEPWLAEIAAASIGEPELKQAERIVRQMDRCGVEAWGRLNWEFHELLYRAADRPITLDIVRSIHEKSERYFRFHVLSPSIREESHREHMELIALCRARQGRAVHKALQTHIDVASEQIVAIVSRMLDEKNG